MLLDRLRQKFGWLLGAGQPPYASDESIDTQFLDATLRKAGMIDGAVSVRSSEIEGFTHRGLTGMVCKVGVKLSDGRALSLVLKRSGSSVDGRKRILFGGSWREAAFYSSAFADAWGALVAKPLYAGASQLLGEYVVLMRDLSKESADASGLNKIMGDQVWGGAMAPADERRALEHAERLFVAVADVHAAHWRSDSLLAHDWLRGAAWRRGADAARWTYSLERTAWYWSNGKKLFVDNPASKVKIPSRFVALIDRSLAASTFVEFENQMRDESFTLTHGDFHASNIYVVASQFKLLDWSEIGVGCGATDIGQCMISDLRSKLFRAHGERLLRAYWSRLVERGVGDYDWPTCRREWIATTIRRWIFYDCLLCGFGEALPAALTQYFVDQLDAFIDEFGDYDATYALGTLGLIT